MKHRQVVVGELREVLEDFPQRLCEQDVLNYVVLGDFEKVIPTAFVLFTNQEKVRASAYRMQSERNFFLFRRSLLKRLLSSVTHLSLSEVNRNIVSDPKPQIQGGPYFTHSNKKTCLIYSFSQFTEIGVDVEDCSECVDYKGIARFFFSNQEQEMLQDQPVSRRRAKFFEIWTQKEATYKCSQSFVQQNIYSWNLNKMQFALASREPVSTMTTFVHHWKNG